MERVELALAALVKDSKEQIDQVLSALDADGVTADRVAVSLARRLDDGTGTFQKTFLPALCLLDALTVRIKEHQSVLAAEIVSYFIVSLSPGTIFRRGLQGAPDAARARAKGYLKRWVGRNCISKAQCDAIIAEVEAGSSSSTAAQSNPPLDASNQPAAAVAVVPAPVRVPTVKATVRTAQHATALIADITACLQKLPLSVAVEVGSGLAQRRVSGALRLDDPDDATIAELEEMHRLVKRTADETAKLQAAADVIRPDSSNQTDSAKQRLEKVLQAAHDDDSAPSDDEGDAEHRTSDTGGCWYKSCLETDVGGPNMLLTTMAGLEFLQAGPLSTSRSAAGPLPTSNRADRVEHTVYTQPRSEAVVRRPFRVPSALGGAKREGGYCRTWGLNEEQWAVERDMTKVSCAKPRVSMQTVGGDGLDGTRKRMR